MNLETRWPRLSQLTSRGLGRSGRGARVGVSGVFCPRCRWVSAGDTGSGGAALGVPPRLPPFGRLAALETPRSAWPAAGRGNRSRVPAWPLPGASPAPLPKRWARVHSCPTESGASPARISREVGLAGHPGPLTASGAPSLAADLLWAASPQVATFLLLARMVGRGTTCSSGPGPGACHL